MRIGQGFDVHSFSESPGDFLVRIGGVDIPHDRSIIAHSDGDVAIHALCDALLGALALGDIGQHFPDTDAAFRNVDSRILLRNVMELIHQKGFLLENTDITIIAEAPRIATHSQKMREILASDLAVDVSRVSVKATTTEKLGFTGRKEGIAAQVLVLLVEKSP